MRHIAFVIVFSIILASLASMTAVTVTAGPSAYKRYSFLLKASGTAFDRSGISHTVTLIVSGTGRGPNPTKFLWLSVASGTVEVQGYGTFRVVGGSGKLIQNCHYITLDIRITSPYGGPVKVWHMRGTTGERSGSKIPILSLQSYCICLPTRPRFTTLRNLGLTGEITIS